LYASEKKKIKIQFPFNDFFVLNLNNIYILRYELGYLDGLLGLRIICMTENFQIKGKQAVHKSELKMQVMSTQASFFVEIFQQSLSQLTV